uniref:myelin protein zero-like protein 1 isoform X4 n=1 Tax=Podarcis muralis TaxID=64176 RepID=UPI00109EFE61|nr:myelin protein zero-like protein 1 isoform X4 [Podarcis muralis]
MAAASTAAATGGPGKRKSSFPAGVPALWLALALALGHGARMASCSAAPEKTAVAVSSPTEIHVESGKIARLSCWFRTSIMISAATSVSWSYQALGSNSRPITVLLEDLYPTSSTQAGSSPPRHVESLDKCKPLCLCIRV